MSLVEMMARALDPGAWAPSTFRSSPAKWGEISSEPCGNVTQRAKEALLAIRTPPPEVVEAMARAAYLHAEPSRFGLTENWDEMEEYMRENWRNNALAAWQAGIDRGMG